GSMPQPPLLKESPDGTNQERPRPAVQERNEATKARAKRIGRMGSAPARHRPRASMAGGGRASSSVGVGRHLYGQPVGSMPHPSSPEGGAVTAHRPLGSAPQPSSRGTD